MLGGERGMRRPSWNKSQAIQQVISLKALLEPNEDSGAGVLRRIVSGPHNNNNNNSSSNIARPASNSADSAKEASTEVQKSASVEEPVPPPPQRKEPPPKLVHEDGPASSAAKAVSPRNQCTADPSARQMTIFYCGKVNVYDGVPPDKAQSIMHLAATPNHVPLDNQFGGTAAARSFRSQFQTAGDRDGPLPPCATFSQAMQTEKIVDYSQLYWEKGNSTRDPEGEANRKVSLQRYREKRKDRERVKNKKNMGSTSSLEVYLNHQLRRHTSNGNSSRSSTSSPPQQPGLLQAVDNQPRIRCLTVDLNENDILENRT